ncbi:MAG: DUF4145 domain-containing protein [Gracilimonas sp.]|uniref:DUF4145 domain-containing protein n=1 Tax=Gracilimonas sp. TaxID=1974203 RepID=UPI003753D85B|nr:DUF4145 domain-containing protein [Gracilimonas sp.]
MYQISKSTTRGWRKNNKFGKYPVSINTICPECGERGTFSIAPIANLTDQKESHLQGVSMRGKCPTCDFKARFIQVGEADKPNYQLFIHPTPKLVRQPIHGVNENSEIFSGRVKKAYLEAIDAYNSKQWIPAAIMCGRALEGITVSLLPEDKRKGNFAKQLRELPNHIDINKTLSDLTNGIRKGRNIAAHFDESLDIDETVSAMLLDLLDSIIEYLFVLPENIESLDKKLQSEDIKSTDGE